MSPPELAGWGVAVTALSGVIAFLYRLLQEERRDRKEAVASERVTAARLEGNTKALEALTDVLGRG